MTGDLTALLGGGAARFLLMHHPTFSRHGADGRQIDVSAQFIALIAKRGIAYDVMRVGPARRARRTLNAVS